MPGLFRVFLSHTKPNDIIHKQVKSRFARTVRRETASL